MDNNNDKPGINEYGVPDNPESKLTGNEVFFDDKAKKMLFGNKNLGGDPMWHTEGVSDMSDHEEPPPLPQSQWNDPEMTGPKWTEEDTKRAIENDELAKIAKEMMETHVFPEPWIKAICDYCYQNNITPDQLIAQHQNYKTAVFQTAAKPPKE